MSDEEVIHDIEYPESDGEPIAESDFHIDWIFRMRDMLKWRYRDQQVYIANDLLLYYVEGEPKKFVTPDCFVVKDCDPGRRRTFKIWEEERFPSFVFEFTSASTKKEDEVFKPRAFAEIGVAEYFLYDPTGDYLKPMLQGFRLQGGSYTRVEADQSGALISEELDLILRLEDNELVLIDRATGMPLQTAGEAKTAEAEEIRAQVVTKETEVRALDATLSEKGTTIADKDAEIEALKAELQRLQQQAEQHEKDG